MEYIEKDFVLSRIDRMLKSKDISGPSRVGLQKLATDVTYRNAGKLKREEQTTPARILSLTGENMLLCCTICRTILKVEDCFCPGCGRIINKEGLNEKQFSTKEQTKDAQRQIKTNVGRSQHTYRV